MVDIVEIWVTTGERVEREFTTDEKKQRIVDEKAAADRAADDVRQKESILAAIQHAKTLGFTDDMIAVMYPNLAP
jgi:hypothetical protein